MDKTNPENSSPNEPDEKEKWRQLGIWNLESAKERSVWDKENIFSIYNQVRSSLVPYFRERLGIEDEEDPGRYDKTSEKDTRQVLEDPLGYIQNVCGNMALERRNPDGYKIIFNGGLNEQEAITMIDKAIHSLGGSREKIEGTLKLFELLREIKPALQEIANRKPESERERMQKKFNREQRTFSDN